MAKHATLAATACWMAALCLAATAHAQLSGYVVELETSSSGSEAAKSIEVECPAGTSLLGGGASVFSSVSGKSLLASRPLFEAGTGDAVGWQGIAQEMVSAATSWGLQSFAICGNARSDWTATQSAFAR